MISLSFLYAYPGMKKVLDFVEFQQFHQLPSSIDSDHESLSPIPADELCCIPDYLLEATAVRHTKLILVFLDFLTQDYREGKQYYEACLFEEAQSKFANAINYIACNDPIYMRANDFFSPLTSAIIAFINVKCDQSMEKKPVVSSKDNSLDHVQSLSEKSRSAKNMGQLFSKQPDAWGEENYETKAQVDFHPDADTKESGHPIEALLKALKNDDQPLPISCSTKNRIFLSNDVLQGVVCVMLTDIAMALALCHQMKGEDREYEDLYHVSSRLHTVSMIFFCCLLFYVRYRRYYMVLMH